MNCNSQPYFPSIHTTSPPTYEMLKEKHEVAVLGVTQGLDPMATTKIDIHSKTSVHDHIIWSLFNIVFVNLCCLGYSVKSRDWKRVGDVIEAQAYDSATECLHIRHLVLGLLLIVIFTIIFVTGSLMILQAISEIIKGYGAS
ncbi:interferon-induced transmembrane protein 3-like [Panthera uncia]|uniref:interferon-induced transmembrane protein 3-like n=1 Tax=Panthera uncia TaxID=29064 RepID=UPI0020FFC501|nr:interferon-induced transmembrane protein 3-like [Panthera uncia]